MVEINNGKEKQDMNEEIEYAEMLEIPVSTVNVVRKKTPKNKRKAQAQPPFYPNEQKSVDLKDSVISQVNDKLLNPSEENITAEAQLFAESVNSEGTLHLENIPERIDTVRLYGENERPYFDDIAGEYPEEDEDRDIPLHPELEGAEKKLRRVLGVEFAVACALCGGIFLTNVFMPGSAINTFFRSLGSPKAEETADTRTYAEFTLTNVVNDYTDVEMTLSQEGVLTFQKECCVYPAVDGKISEVTVNDGGMYTLKIEHSDSFTGVIEGLSQVYYNVGDEVKSNVPVGYSNGEGQIQYTMYSGGELLNCFQITEENCLAWVVQE